MNKSDKIILAALSLVLIISFFLDKFVVQLVTPLSIEFPVLNFLFSFALVVVLIAFISIYFYKEKRKYVLPLLISVVVSYIAAFILKLIIARPRFFAEKFYLLGIPDYSFPSSHAAISFALIPLLFANTKKLKWIWLGYAVIIAISRLVLKQHYLSDVIGGALLGFGAGILVVYFMKKKK